MTGAVLVTGPAGIGKTTELRRSAAAARALSRLARGLVRVDPGTDGLRIADPGLQQWVVQHNATLSAQLELSDPGRNAVAGSQAQQASGVRPVAGRHRVVDR